VLLAIICLCLALFPLNKGPCTTETCFLKKVAILCILCNIHSYLNLEKFRRLLICHNLCSKLLKLYFSRRILKFLDFSYLQRFENSIAFIN